MRIVILERNSVGTDISVERFKDFGEVSVYANTVTSEEVRERVKEADIIIANKAPMKEESLKDALHVKLICEFATGYDNVDLDYCKKRKIAVANVRNYSTASVAQHTFALALSLMEHLPHYDSYVKSGEYAGQSRFSNFDVPFPELDGKVWGIIGMGNIGKKVAHIAEAFGCHVIFYSASGKSRCTEYERVSFDTLLQKSDVLSLHCPLTQKTRHLLDDRAFEKMKKTAVLINVARGPVVDNVALYHALEDNKILAAGLDVLEEEPLREDNPLGRIKDSNRLIITPHLAWAGTEARERCVWGVYENIKAFLNKTPQNIVKEK